MRQLSKRILVGITGKTEKDFINKLREIKHYKIKKIALFLEYFPNKLRPKIYKAIMNSNIKKIPFNTQARHITIPCLTQVSNH